MHDKRRVWCSRSINGTLTRCSITRQLHTSPRTHIYSVDEYKIHKKPTHQQKYKVLLYSAAVLFWLIWWCIFLPSSSIIGWETFFKWDFLISQSPLRKHGVFHGRPSHPPLLSLAAREVLNPLWQRLDVRFSANEERATVASSRLPPAGLLLLQPRFSPGADLRSVRTLVKNHGDPQTRSITKTTPGTSAYIQINIFLPTQLWYSVRSASKCIGFFLILPLWCRSWSPQSPDRLFK